MGQSHRTLKVADRIKVVVANLLETKIKDPRLGFVTVTDARVTGDLQQASVFYTVLGGLDERAATAAALDSAKGAIRSALDDAGFQNVAIMAYSAKYASALYGPFRDAVDVQIAGGGHRKGYQQDWRNAQP